MACMKYTGERLAVYVLVAFPRLSALFGSCNNTAGRLQPCTRSTCLSVDRLGKDKVQQSIIADIPRNSSSRKIGVGQEACVMVCDGV